MKCPNCQSEQNPNFKFCTNCGSDLSTKIKSVENSGGKMIKKYRSIKGKLIKVDKSKPYAINVINTAQTVMTTTQYDLSRMKEHEIDVQVNFSISFFLFFYLPLIIGYSLATVIVFGIIGYLFHIEITMLWIISVPLIGIIIGFARGYQSAKEKVIQRRIRKELKKAWGDLDNMYCVPEDEWDNLVEQLKNNSE